MCEQLPRAIRQRGREGRPVKEMVFLVKYECKKMKSEEKVGGMQASEEKATLLFQKHNPQKSPPATTHRPPPTLWRICILLFVCLFLLKNNNTKGKNFRKLVVIAKIASNFNLFYTIKINI
jgi:hypothetical protein